MNNAKMLLISFLFMLGGGYFYFNNMKKVVLVDKTKSEENIYYTCPMHPQIHQSHPGECPICHMRLVKMNSINQQNVETNINNTDEKRKELTLSSGELVRIGVPTAVVESMNLVRTIPIAGRVLNSQTVSFQIYENELKDIKRGLKFKGTLGYDESLTIKGVITNVDNSADIASKTVKVVGSLTESVHLAVSETTFSGEILIELKDSIVIPESAVVHTGKGSLVYLVNQKKDEQILKPIFVKLGAKAQGYYQVIKGLSLNDVVASGPNFLIDSEAKIRGANE